MSELEMLSTILDSRRLARDVLEEKHGGATVTTRPWWVPEGTLDASIEETTSKPRAHRTPRSDFPFA